MSVRMFPLLTRARMCRGLMNSMNIDVSLYLCTCFVATACGSDSFFWSPPSCGRFSGTLSTKLTGNMPFFPLSSPTTQSASTLDITLILSPVWEGTWISDKDSPSLHVYNYSMWHSDYKHKLPWMRVLPVGHQSHKELSRDLYHHCHLLETKSSDMA